MHDLSEMNEFYKDAFRELGNIGAGNAATALSQMVGRPVTMSVPEVMIVPIEKVPDLVGGADQVVAGIYFEVYGDLPSNILLTFPHKNLVLLTDMLMKETAVSGVLLNEMKLSALKELGTILSGAYLNALAKFLDVRMIPSVPALSIDILTAVLDTILIELSQQSRFALMLRTEIIETEAKIIGDFFLIPEPNALERIIQAIAKAAGVSDAG